jgi:5'-methylthioadenosine nucleosidase
MIHAPISKIAIIVAMQGEAQPIIDALGLKAQPGAFDSRLPLQAYSNTAGITLVTNGKCPQHQCDRVGTQAATLAAWETIRHFAPDLLISAGTAGGFCTHGTCIGDLFLSSDIKYHHRCAPLPEFTDFLTGTYKNILPVQRLAQILQVKVGVVTSGDAMTTLEQDMRVMRSLQTRCKDMEAAAIAEVAALCGVGVVAVKAVTDIVDTEACTAQQFLKNYTLAVTALAQVIPKLVALVQNATWQQLGQSPTEAC